jgi:hypothetical protein
VSRVREQEIKELHKAERNMELRFASRVRDSAQSVGNKKLKNFTKQRGTGNKDSPAE